jgi:hypothetical protein
MKKGWIPWSSHGMTKSMDTMVKPRYDKIHPFGQQAKPLKKYNNISNPFSHSGNITTMTKQHI